MDLVSFLLQKLQRALAFRNLMSIDRILSGLVVAGRLESERGFRENDLPQARRTVELAEQQVLEERKGASKL